MVYLWVLQLGRKIYQCHGVYVECTGVKHDTQKTVLANWNLVNDISIEEYSCLESVVYVCSYHVYILWGIMHEHFMVCRALKWTLSEKNGTRLLTNACCIVNPRNTETVVSHCTSGQVPAHNANSKCKILSVCRMYLAKEAQTGRFSKFEGI